MIISQQTSSEQRGKDFIMTETTRERRGRIAVYYVFRLSFILKLQRSNEIGLRYWGNCRLKREERSRYAPYGDLIHLLSLSPYRIGCSFNVVMPRCERTRLIRSDISGLRYPHCGLRIDKYRISDNKKARRKGNWAGRFS